MLVNCNAPRHPLQLRSTRSAMIGLRWKLMKIPALDLQSIDQEVRYVDVTRWRRRLRPLARIWCTSKNQDANTYVFKICL
jgi:hypothetical protein